MLKASTLFRSMTCAALFAAASTAAFAQGAAVKADPAKGQQLSQTCAACHGADGKGNQALGAPNLTDKIWLHGWGEEAIVAMVTQGKLNQMPGQEGRLTPSQIHVLSAYVWGLSQPATQKP